MYNLVPEGQDVVADRVEVVLCVGRPEVDEDGLYVIDVAGALRRHDE